MLPELTVSNEEGFEAKAYHSHPSFKHYLLAEGTPVFGRAFFWYQSSNGEVNARVVDVIRYKDTENGKYMLGWCYLRNAYRTFYAGGFAVTDCVTGKTWSKVGDWLASIEGAPAIEQPPSSEELQKWLNPVGPTPLETAKQWLDELGKYATELFGPGCTFEMLDEGVADCVRVTVMTPKLRGAGSTFRAQITYVPYDAVRTGDAELDARRSPLLLPWWLYTDKSTEYNTFEELRAELLSLLAGIYAKMKKMLAPK